MTDRNRDDLDEVLGDLRSALDIGPSPGFAARVRERVATETASSTRWWWMGAAAVAAVIIVIAMPRSGAVDDRALVQTKQVGRAAAPVASAVGPATTRNAEQSTRLRKPRSLRNAPVIVPPGQEEALQRLVTALRDGTVASPHIDQPSGPIEIPVIVAPELIQLSAIRIDPIDEEF